MLDSACRTGFGKPLPEAPIGLFQTEAAEHVGDPFLIVDPGRDGGEELHAERGRRKMAGKAPRRSRYDELHDKYHKILTTKAGTRYEQLAALVFKALESKNAVIHDMELAGEDPQVKHQIDVTVEIAGKTRRAIIECKDFDISGERSDSISSATSAR